MFRRIFLQFIASILGLLLQAAVAEKSALKATVAKPAPNTSFMAAGSITVPFEYYKQHIYIPVQVNGVAGLIFMVDSGADRNILGLRTCRKLGLPAGRLKQEQKVGFGDGLIYTARQKHVDALVDSIPVARSMAVIDLNRFERHFSHATDGMLGVPFFQRFVVKMDFGNRLMTLYPAGRYSYHGLGVRVPLLQTNRNFLLIPILIGSSNGGRHPAQVVIDTGSNVTLMLYESFIHALQLDSNLARAQDAKAYGLNGYYSIKRGSIPFLQIGNAETKDLPVDYMEPDAEVHPVKQSAGAIGTGILQGFQTVIFDVPHRQMIFEVKSPREMPGVVRVETAGP